MSTPNQPPAAGAGTEDPPKTPPQGNDDKTPPVDAAGEGSPDSGGEPKASGKTFTQDEVNRLLAKERRDLEKKQKDAEDRAKLSEEERSKAEIAALQAQIRERDTRDFVQAESQKAEARNPAAVYKLIKDDLEFDDKGKVTNLKEVLTAAKTDYPELFGKEKPSGSAPDAGDQDPTGKKLLTREQIEKMSQEEINSRWTEIQASMKTWK